MEGAFSCGIGGQSHGEKHLILITEIHQRAERQAPGRGKLHGGGGDAVGERPLDAGRLAGVTRIYPVDVPSFIQLEVQADGGAASRLDGILQREELDGKVLRAHRPRHGRGGGCGGGQAGTQGQAEGWGDLAKTRHTWDLLDCTHIV